MKDNRPIRVLHVVHSLEPGGMENGVVNIAVGLSARGIETRIACLERRGAFADRLPAGTDVTVLGKKTGFSIRATFRLWQLLRQTGADVLHSHNLGPLIYSGLASAGGFATRIIHGEHAHLLPEERSGRRLKQRKRLYRRCRAVHTVSEPMRQELVDLGLPASRIRTIWNGVDLTRFKPGSKENARQALRLPNDAFLLGIVGRFGPYKRHDLLLAAFERIGRTLPGLNLVIIGGGGPMEEAIRMQASRSMYSSRIHFTGFLPDPTIGYHALDMLVIPSTNEGHSNALIEAMACETVVLANTGCGHEAVINEDRVGVIADLNSPEALADGILRLATDPSRRLSISKAARQCVAEGFSIESMLAGYERLYREAAGGRTAWT